MSDRYQILPAADRDIEAQAEYFFSEAGLETALRFYDAAASTFQQISRMPGMGQRWESPHPRLAALRVCRIDGFPNHLVFYRTTGDGIEIVRILHAARNLDAALRSGED